MFSIIISSFPGLYANLFFCIGLIILMSVTSDKDYRYRLFFAAVAIFFNFRYLDWRYSETMIEFDWTPASVWQWSFFISELFAVAFLSWHLVLFALKPESGAEKNNGRLSPADTRPENSPSVDVFIATYNEEEPLLLKTICAAKNIDYPNFKVWVLDDGCRSWLESLCESLQVSYIAREERQGYKAGNLNHALKRTPGEFILCLDADFVVKPEILLHTLGYFRSPEIGIVQTPQNFHNPDAIQHNLGGGVAWPEDQRVFTDIIQPCRDKWDNAFCYGTNFVVRRECLEKVGGFSEATICEDLYLTYQLKELGWKTKYHEEELARGQAAITLNEFIKQRVRWCTGTVQCLYLPSGPMLSKALSLKDRIFFLDPVFYYLSALWVFMALLSPGIFWWTGITPFNSDHGHLVLMLLPRMMISMIVLYWLSDKKVVPIVSEIGRVVGIFYTVGALIKTLMKPKGTPFQVTLKNATRETTKINWNVLLPHLILLVITLSGIFLNASKYASSVIDWGQNLGIILALTLYFLWMNFITILTCIEPRINASSNTEDDQQIVLKGGVYPTIRALAKKVIE